MHDHNKNNHTSNSDTNNSDQLLYYRESTTPLFPPGHYSLCSPG